RSSSGWDSQIMLFCSPVAGCKAPQASAIGALWLVVLGAWQPSGSRPVVLCRVAQSRCWSERGVEVVPEVVDVFAADAQAQQPGRHVFLAGEPAAPLDGAFDAAQAGGVDDDLHGV